MRDQLAVTCEAMEAYKRTYTPTSEGAQNLSTDYNMLWKQLNNGAKAFGFIVDDVGWKRKVIYERSTKKGEFEIVGFAAFNTLEEAIVECKKYKLEFITFTP